MMMYKLEFVHVLQERDIWRWRKLRRWVWSAKSRWWRVWIIKVVPEIHFAALLKLKAPARTISVESTLALNPLWFGAKVTYVHTPGPHPPHCKAIHDSLSVLPKLEKSQETWSNALHMANYCPAFRACTPLTQVPYVPKSLPRALKNIKAPAWIEAQPLKVGAAGHSEIKCWKKDFTKYLYKTNHY